MFSDQETKKKKEILVNANNLPPKIHAKIFLQAVTNANCVVWKVMPPFCCVNVETFPHVFTKLYEEKYSFSQ